jgi:small-conductance mechanosensitive channel
MAAGCQAVFVLTGAALIIATLGGYVGLARFIATQIVMTGAILVTMYIGILTGKAVAKQNALADTVVGRYLEKRFGLGQVALDQAGLAAGLGIYVLVVLFFIPLILLQWGFQIADIEAWAYRIFTEIKIGSITISIVGIFAGMLMFAAGYVVTRWFQRWLDGNVMARSRVDTGVRNSVKTGVGYLGIGLAGLIGVSAAGFDLSNLALVAGALSLGVGFGLQNIVSNFVSGLILLVERPFKVGDWVVTGTTEGFVKRISVRATEIETFQRQTIMVPNSLFINASVGNWTHKNKLGRSDIPVTVSYNSAPRQVMDTLLQIAAAHPLVLKNPNRRLSSVVVQYDNYVVDRLYTSRLRAIPKIRFQYSIRVVGNGRVSAKGEGRHHRSGWHRGRIDRPSSDRARMGRYRRHRQIGHPDRHRLDGARLRLLLHDQPRLSLGLDDPVLDRFLREDGPLRPHRRPRSGPHRRRYLDGRDQAQADLRQGLRHPRPHYVSPPRSRRCSR